MPLTTHLVNFLAKVPPLSEDNFHAWQKSMKMFFFGIGASYISTDSTVPAGSEELDKEVLFCIWCTISSEFQYLVEDKTSGLEGWKAVHMHFAQHIRGKFRKGNEPTSPPVPHSYPSSPFREDEKGYRWCNPTNEGHCHRCGRSGHIAARCIHDMPQHIKDWVMAGPPHQNQIHIAVDNPHPSSPYIGHHSRSPSPVILHI